MKKNIFTNLIIAIFILTTFQYIHARESSPLRDFWYSFDGSAVGARAIGMGGAFSAIASSPEAVYWNPAGLYYIQNRLAYFEYNEYVFEKNEHKDIAFQNDPLKGKNFTFFAFCNEKGAVSYRPLSDYSATDENGNRAKLKLGQYSLSTAGITEDDSIFGVNVNYFHGFLGYVSKTSTGNDLDISSANGWGLDWGFLFPSSSNNLVLGLMLQNAPAFLYWENFKKDVLPFILRAGLAINSSNKHIFAFDYERRYYRDRGNLIIYHTGYEEVINNVIVRIGAYGEDLSKSNETTYTTGITYLINKFKVDLSVERQNILDNQNENQPIHRIKNSISIII
ncbi:hypothetical protein ACFL4A_00850 [bacterium]